MKKAYGFKKSLDVGAQGCALVVQYFSNKRKWDIVDVQSDKEWQRRDVDLLINGRMVEVKADMHEPGSMFAELTITNEKQEVSPGCIWKSRAELWTYVFPLAQRFYLIELPKLQLWLYQHGNEYDTKRIHSYAGKRTWYAEGIVVPFKPLQAERIAHLFRMDTGYVEPAESERKEDDEQRQPELSGT